VVRASDGYGAIGLDELQLREELGGGCEVLGTRKEVEAPRGARYLTPRT
jgi:hypothetical protein